MIAVDIIYIYIYEVYINEIDEKDLRLSTSVIDNYKLYVNISNRFYEVIIN